MRLRRQTELARERLEFPQLVLHALEHELDAEIGGTARDAARGPAGDDGERDAARLAAIFMPCPSRTSNTLFSSPLSL